MLPKTDVSFSLTIIQGFFICPVGPFLHVLKMWVFFTQARIKHCHLYPWPCKHKNSCCIEKIFQHRFPQSPHIFKERWKAAYQCVPSAKAHLPGGSICATWRGMARSSRRLEWRPVACQNPEPSDRLVLLNVREDCHDCHLSVSPVALQSAAGSAAVKTQDGKHKTLH